MCFYVFFQNPKNTIFFYFFGVVAHDFSNTVFFSRGRGGVSEWGTVVCGGGIDVKKRSNKNERSNKNKIRKNVTKIKKRL